MFVCVCVCARACSCCVSFCVIVFCVLTTMSSAINYVCLPLTLFFREPHHNRKYHSNHNRNSNPGSKSNSNLKVYD